VGQFDLRPDAEEQSGNRKHQPQWIKDKHKLVSIDSAPGVFIQLAGRVPIQFARSLTDIARVKRFFLSQRGTGETEIGALIRLRRSTTIY
jgi:hypothetical protein